MHRNRFGFYLQEKRNGALWIDKVPSDLHTGKMTRHKLEMPAAYWSLKLMDVKVRGKGTGVCPNGCKVAIDSGTSLLTGPTAGAKKVLNALQLDPGCANFDDLGNLTSVLEATDDNGKKFNKEYPLVPREFVLESFGRTSCRAGLSMLDVPKPNGPVWILGDMFMMKYFSVFDRDANSVHLGLANPKASTSRKDMIKMTEIKKAKSNDEDLPDWTRFDSRFDSYIKPTPSLAVQEVKDVWEEKDDASNVELVQDDNEEDDNEEEQEE